MSCASIEQFLDVLWRPAPATLNFGAAISVSSRILRYPATTDPVRQDSWTGSGNAVRGRVEAFEEKRGESALFDTLSGLNWRPKVKWVHDKDLGVDVQRSTTQYR
ncbi:hypothetical protein C8J57DRAFT_1515926 [Mycena rebaudengoi]|nr:hypothetical protein C8J57DRAFT_1515926 [Mycena rebaudengoi]